MLIGRSNDNNPNLGKETVNDFEEGKDHIDLTRCQIHKARNVIERLPKPLHACVRKALRQAWEIDDADKG